MKSTQLHYRFESCPDYNIMKLKLHIKHTWKKMFVLPSDGVFNIARDFRNYQRTVRQNKIRKAKALQASIYDLSDMD